MSSSPGTVGPRARGALRSGIDWNLTGMFAKSRETRSPAEMPRRGERKLSKLPTGYWLRRFAEILSIQRSEWTEFVYAGETTRCRIRKAHDPNCLTPPPRACGKVPHSRRQ